MSERWKPECGETYYFVGNTGNIGAYEWRADLTDTRYYEVGNCLKTKAKAEAAAEKVKALLLSLHEPTTNCNQLPKLTADVFDRPDCPEWAQYAAVSSDGRCLVCREYPILIGGRRWANPESYWEKTIDGKFDTTDWQNSLIKRPAKLPDWCKVGEWVWLDPQKIYGPAGYKKIKNIDGLELTFADGCCIYFSHKIKQARLRPYNDDEMKALVGKPITMLDGAVCLCSVYSKRDKSVILDSVHWDAQELLNSGYTLDGKPCGKLEHLNDKGEWVE